MSAGGGILGLASALCLTLGLLALALWLLRRLAGRPAAATGVGLEVVGRLPMGPRAGVALLRVGSRVLVVSTGEGGMRTLAELEGEDLEEALARPAPVALPTWAAAPFLRKAGALAVLALLPALASAQQLGGLPAPTPPAAIAPAQAGTANARAAASAPAASPSARGAAVPVAATVPAAERGIPGMPRVQVAIGGGSEELKLSGAVGVVVLMGALTLLPALFLLMTSFTRILIVLHFLRTAIGTQSSPPGQLLVAIAVLLTGVVMNPVLEEANRTALQPYLEGRLTQVEAYRAAIVPFRGFMLANTREQDVGTFAELAGAQDADSIEALPTPVVVSAFMTSELRTAFQMGFVLFLPFVVIDLVVASVLMSLGMFMLPPAMISLPFKLLLFVLADGWPLVMQNLVASFRH